MEGGHMTVRELTQIAISPVTILGASTGKTLKRNVTTETLERNPTLGTLNILGVQTIILPDERFTCWVSETDFNATK